MQVYGALLYEMNNTDRKLFENCTKEALDQNHIEAKTSRLKHTRRVGPSTASPEH